VCPCPVRRYTGMRHKRRRAWLSALKAARHAEGVRSGGPASLAMNDEACSVCGVCAARVCSNSLVRHEGIMRVANMPRRGGVEVWPARLKARGTMQ